MKRSMRLLSVVLAFLILGSQIPMEQVHASEVIQSQDTVQNEENIPEVNGNETKTDFDDEGQAEQEEGVQDDSESEKAQDTTLLNYIFIEKTYVTVPDVQNIMASIGTETTILESAVLKYTNLDTGEVTEIAAKEIVGNTVLFTVDHHQQETAEYQLTELRYIIEQEEYNILFSDAGMDMRYGVNKEVETKPDNLVVSNEEYPEVEANVVTTDEEGNVLSEQDIQGVLENSESAIPAVMALNEIEKAATKSGNLIVVLDPGHDSTHAGTQASGLAEEVLTLKVAKYCKAELEKYNGVTVYLTREGESCANGGSSVTSGTCLEKRVEFAASKQADVFVSFHMNSSTSTSAHGAGVYYPNSNYRPDLGQEGKELAAKIFEELSGIGLSAWAGGILEQNAQEYKYPDNSAADYLSVIRNSKLAGIPAVLIEHAFQSNASDVNNFLDSDEKLQKLGVADATAIAEYYGLQKGLAFKWTLLGANTYKVGQSAQLYYATNTDAVINVDVYYGNNNFLKTLVSNKSVQTNDQVVSWDLKDSAGNYVENGTYRFTITAKDATGKTVTVHKYFQVTGNDPFAYKWTLLGANSYQIGQNAQLYYATNKSATISVDVYYGNNNFLKTLVSNKSVQTNDQVVSWDLKDSAGNYVENGTYRFTITAKDATGKTVTVHKYFQVTGNEPFAYKWTLLGANSYQIGQSAQLYYATNKSATISIDVYYGNNNFLKALVSNKSVQTNDQVVSWDLKDGAGNYVENGTYRFTITAKDATGKTVTVHKYFQVTGNDPLAYKWTTLGASSYKIGQEAELYYAVNRAATITVDVYYGNNSYMKNLVSNKNVQTNDQVVTWDLKDAKGNYVENGTYRFTITAVAANGTKVTVHKWFQVTGNPPLSYQSISMKSNEVDGATSAELYFSTNKSATVKVEVFYGNNNFLKTLVSEKQIGTEEQTVVWDLKDSEQKYVDAGLYRFTVTAMDSAGKTVVSHQYFNINYVNIMGESQTTVDKMVAFYNDRYEYPEFYKNTEAPTIEDFCRIYYEECEKEGLRAEVAFSQAMKETGFLQYRGIVKIEQFNFAGLDATGEILPDGTPESGRSYSGVREGIRAHVQRLKAYAVKGTTPESFAEQCVDMYKFADKWWCDTIVGCSPYVEWLGKEQNPSGYGWATDPNYGFSIKNDYLAKLMSY